MVQTDSDAARARGEPDAAADAARSRRFQQLALPHLDAAYNLARWLCGNPNDAEDVVQEAFMRAFRFFDTFRGDSARPWLLAIVRRTWYTEWRRRAPSHDMLEFDETMDDATFDGWSAGGDDPQTLLIRDEDARQVHDALARLPVEYREVLILRELEEMGYREIAVVADVPIGTVMSRLARGRRKLAEVLMAQERGGAASAGAGAGRRGALGVSHAGTAESAKSVGGAARSGDAGTTAASVPKRTPSDEAGQSMRSVSPVSAGASTQTVRHAGAGRAAAVAASSAAGLATDQATNLATDLAAAGSPVTGLSTTSPPAIATATATVTQLRAFADGRPLIIPGAAADAAQETPDGL
ncbi:RNA polymerase sigma factor [Paraburkholderia antibiotica]|uniref:RNA polymerase sigma factor n=1 Tax=Paraburkholderia antibiotica TaxID=2728839 RepID=UPI002E31FAC8|nr:RNA polymerase sigma factor [Paraburkholderia antibiotica]